MEIRWLADALDDVDAIYDYVGADDPRAAERMIHRILASVVALAEMPHRGRPGRWAGTRELVIPGTPYLVPYRVRDGAIEVLRVLHGARRWPDEP